MTKTTLKEKVINCMTQDIIEKYGYGQKAVNFCKIVEKYSHNMTIIKKIYYKIMQDD